jgi:uncharacterized protein YjbI with pentapeptide repeats
LAENTQTHVLVSAIERAIGQDDPYVEGLQASWEELGFDADLRLFEFHDVWLDHCVLRELHARKASFYECTLTNCDLSGADLREAYFARTTLRGVDLSSCNIAGISVSDTREELRGLVIGVEQAQDLVGMLGDRMVDV